MTPTPSLPDLRVVAVDSLQPHERIDTRRLDPLVRAIRVEAVLRNPPLVLPSGKENRYAILDGVNRTEAFRTLRLPHILVQVVAPGRESVQLKTWNHVIAGCPLPSLLEKLVHVPGLRIAKDHADLASLSQGRADLLALLVAPGGLTLEIIAKDRGVEGRVCALDRLVCACCEIGILERSEQFCVDQLLVGRPGLTAGLVYTPLGVEQILEIVRKGLRLPSGLTRFVVSPRALRLNYPISRLAGGGSVEEKQLEVESWLQVRLGERGVRYYAEPTWSFDE